ncbi:hypothetical protein ABW19_dt0207220 [Dactylella cylindrospora]|nr:hypothetical protein ABW19_dt0207220 [Dactylella cylindrospora]
MEAPPNNISDMRRDSSDGVHVIYQVQSGSRDLKGMEKHIPPQYVQNGKAPVVFLPAPAPVPDPAAAPPLEPRIMGFKQRIFLLLLLLVIDFERRTFYDWSPRRRVNPRPGDSHGNPGHRLGVGPDDCHSNLGHRPRTDPDDHALQSNVGRHGAIL